MLIKYNQMQQYSDIIYCKVILHVSGVTAPIIRSTKTVTAASGTGHNTGTATSVQRGQIGPDRALSGHVGDK